MNKFTLTVVLSLATNLHTFAQDKYLERGNAFLNNGQFDKAGKTFRQAIRANPNNLIYQCQLGFVLIQQKAFIEAENILNAVIQVDSTNEAAIVYSGLGNYYNSDFRKAISRFEKALRFIDKQRGQYFSVNWLIGKCYSILLKTEGLTYEETDRMFDCYEEYLRLQPNADDAEEIRRYVDRKKSRRPPRNVIKWIDL